MTPEQLFDLRGTVAVVTGGSGVLGSAMARGLSAAGARVGVLGRRLERAREVVAQIERSGGEAMPLAADVLDPATLARSRDDVVGRWGRVDILINAAGGNLPQATLANGGSVLDLPVEGWRAAMDLNFLGTLLPIQTFGAAMAAAGRGSIVNVSSMASQRVLTRVPAYSAAKAAVENLTRWLAVELSRKHGAGLRVNAVAPGFFIGEQNRRLLTNEDGSLTPRGGRIIEHTPAGRFGEPGDLIGTVIWLCGPGSRFVNGTVIPVDGGFSAFSGV
ncbi:MAG TPA: SDR family oxidoreductase [bacterium]|nr:SDR family oxidoreductase [bacterium]